ncbi:MAG TPA: rRNA maturation RNase YbeY [Verrucomicrobiae bacterium]|jgi:probable rRNA maturation factor|nr:rRNA maturation RNase YbeY [Verrucomicrobiae bacterium]
MNSKEELDGATIGISITNRQRAYKVDLQWLKKIAAATLIELKIERAELGINLVGAKEMASINEKFLGHEGPTDVITFDYSESVPGGDAALRKWCCHRRPRPRRAGGTFAGDSTIISGEIFICIPEAERQAKIFGTDWRSETVRYLIHGILHLTGHDDLQPVARKKMKQVEGRLVRKFSSLILKMV